MSSTDLTGAAEWRALHDDGNWKKHRMESFKGLLDLPRYKLKDPRLAIAIGAIAEATAEVSWILSNYVKHTYAGSQNESGDDQLHLDLDCDKAVFDAVRECGVYVIAASEETPEETVVGSDSGESVFSLGFDPLDGSSVIDANFTVGSIYGIWPGRGVLNRTGREQMASAMALYGARTTLCIGLPAASLAAEDASNVVLEFTLVHNRTHWVLSRDSMTIAPSGKVFAPGNLRASNDNESYNKLVQHWIEERYTLRYTGAMVPDVYHVFVKAKGIFTNVSSEKAKAKLRLLYEVAPIGLLVECAGGVTTHETMDKSVLDIVIENMDQRLGCCFGSSEEVAKYKQFMF